MKKSNINLCLTIGILVLLLGIVILYHRKSENFQDFHTGVEIQHPDHLLRHQAQIISEADVGNKESVFDDTYIPSEETHNSGVNMNNYIKKTDLERVARVSTREYCPVSPNYNPSDYVKKSEIDLQQSCPKMPDLKDYVLKSTIPPIQKCPSCICPKVKVSAGMCKECPPQKNNCPPCKPCGVEQCKDVIKCEPSEKQVSCPKCPAPEPCPKAPEKVCPSFTIPEPNIKCPPPQPCPMPQPCRDGQGRCPEKPEQKCKYYGIKEVAQERSAESIVNELLISDDPKLKELLENLKNKINLNMSPSPTEMTTLSGNNLPEMNTTQMNNSNHIPAATTQASTPEELNVHQNHNMIEVPNLFSSMEVRLNGRAQPIPTENTSLLSTNVSNDQVRSCNLRDGDSCPYNTELNM